MGENDTLSKNPGAFLPGLSFGAAKAGREGKRLEPILKWAGGKSRELGVILALLPPAFENFYDPFVGGGSVFLAIEARRAFINDRSSELIGLYRIIRARDRERFFEILFDMARGWEALGDLVRGERDYLVRSYRNVDYGLLGRELLPRELEDFVSRYGGALASILAPDFAFASRGLLSAIRKCLLRKIGRMKHLERKKGPLPEADIIDNMESAFRGALYTQYRDVYNRRTRYGLDAAQSTSVFFFIRNFAYSAMFRYNSRGEFNVPYGGIAYNRKNFRKKVEYLASGELLTRLEDSVIECSDFEHFLTRYSPGRDDFIFLDPPYDTDFNTYVGTEFTREDQKRLADFLLGKTPSKWLLVIKKTDYILGLYSGKGLSMDVFDKTYNVSFMNRNERAAEHLLIRNY